MVALAETATYIFLFKYAPSRARHVQCLYDLNQWSDRLSHKVYDCFPSFIQLRGVFAGKDVGMTQLWIKSETA